MLLFILMVLCDAFYYSVKQDRMMGRVLGGVSGELSLLCDLRQVHEAKCVWDSFLGSKMRG